jgi:hypothetical protein
MKFCQLLVLPLVAPFEVWLVSFHKVLRLLVKRPAA